MMHSGTRARALALALLGAVLLPALAAAEPPVDSAGTREPAYLVAKRLPAVDAFPTPLAAPMWRIGLTLAGLSAASGALAFWARRRRRALGGADAEIRILANRSLSSRHQVVLIDVGGHRLLVGTGSEAITLLADLSEPELFANALDRHAPPPDRSGAEFGAIGRFEGLDA